MEIISPNPEHNVKELKEKIRSVIQEFTKTNESINISVVYYDLNTYKKPLKKK
jgi:hypothetical protein